MRHQYRSADCPTRSPQWPRYENKRVPVDDPKRFRVELSFSDGSAISPFDVRCLPATPPSGPRASRHCEC